ncbi:MAG TPA: glycosyltransferase family 39 protein [Methylomirabilota bacterium]|jgi:transmembrane protein TMEM260 (protein O-mannosyltransferase)|nr:glycosyltransferase family 39 protein [Methylomirabilota bacterium]
MASAGRRAVVRVAPHGDLAIALGLGVVTLLSRWPYRARMLYNWDAVQFALALHEFDIAKHQPHPPGYLLYVALGRLLNASLGDPTLAYVALAMLFSAGTTFVLYSLARRLYDRATALIAASLLAVSPLFWFYGSVGLTYAGEAFAASVVAWFAYGALTGHVPSLYWGALAVGLTGGMRQSVLVLLLPLWLGSALLGIRSRRRVAIAGGILLASVLAWLLPMLWLTGGPAAYVGASTQLYGSMLLPTSVLGGSLEVTLAQARYLLESTLVGLGPLGLVALALPAYARGMGWNRPEWFLLGWMVPPIIFYMLIHFGQAGYVLTFLPALVILLSRVLAWVVAAGSERLRRPNWRWALTTATLLPLVLINTGFFVSARPLPREFNNRGGDGWVWRARDEFHDWIMSRTAAALREHEAVIRTYVETIRAVYDPSDTALVTELGNPRSYPWLRHAMFYMPEYPTYQVQVGAMPLGFYAPQYAATMILTPGARITLPAGMRQLVWFVDHWDPATQPPAGLREVQLPYGRFLYVLLLTRTPVEYAGYTFERAAR